MTLLSAGHGLTGIGIPDATGSTCATTRMRSLFLFYHCALTHRTGWAAAGRRGEYPWLVQMGCTSPLAFSIDTNAVPCSPPGCRWVQSPYPSYAIRCAESLRYRRLQEEGYRTLSLNRFPWTMLALRKRSSCIRRPASVGASRSRRTYSSQDCPDDSLRLEWILAARDPDLPRDRDHPRSLAQRRGRPFPYTWCPVLKRPLLPNLPYDCLLVASDTRFTPCTSRATPVAALSPFFSVAFPRLMAAASGASILRVLPSHPRADAGGPSAAPEYRLLEYRSPRGGMGDSQRDGCRLRAAVHAVGVSRVQQQLHPARRVVAEVGDDAAGDARHLKEGVAACDTRRDSCVETVVHHGRAGGDRERGGAGSVSDRRTVAEAVEVRRRRSGSPGGTLRVGDYGTYRDRAFRAAWDEVAHADQVEDLTAQRLGGIVSVIPALVMHGEVRFTLPGRPLSGCRMSQPMSVRFGPSAFSVSS